MSIQAMINQTASSVLSSGMQVVGTKYLWQKSKIEDLEGQVSALQGEKTQLQEDITKSKRELEAVENQWMEGYEADVAKEQKALKKMGIKAQDYHEAFSKGLVVSKAEAARNQEESLRFLRENLSGRQLRKLDYEARKAGLDYDFKGGKA